MTAASPKPWPAPAKLNLFLHIVGRRPDGYHELQTCFQFVDLCDEVMIAQRDDGAIRRGAGAAGVDPEQDLCVRAALALKAATGTRRGADISVSKRIPMGAGLGGGSSDAATCLRALNELWGLRLTAQELANIGLKLGADVPVVVMTASRWCGADILRWRARSIGCRRSARPASPVQGHAFSWCASPRRRA